MIKKVLATLTRKWCKELLEKGTLTEGDIISFLEVSPERRLEFREVFKEEYGLYDVDGEQRELICDMAEASAFGTKESIEESLENYRKFIVDGL